LIAKPAEKPFAGSASYLVAPTIFLHIMSAVGALLYLVCHPPLPVVFVRAVIFRFPRFVLLTGDSMMPFCITIRAK
jgi:hypothetical protein